ncbi:putative ankyrin repeat protein [Chloropicon roscoffensis]|uniref:Ankyrin repeat protein n=1 Tax=Chloropicon roscoffensis TaxID=1461544 RepID=A0AAX4PDL9_9CHLO
MSRDAGEPTAKRAKADEEKEEEDPLVRRREELVRLLERARAKGKVDARAKEELLTLCSKLEAKNEKLLRRLPPELWQKILDENVQQNDLLALAMTCRFFREKQEDLGWEVETNWNQNRLVDLRKSGRMSSHSLGWFRWVCDTLEILPGFLRWDDERVKGAVYEGDLLNCAAFQGSVEILRWLHEEKGCKLNRYYTGEWAGMGGSVEIFEYLRGKGYQFDTWVCYGAARGGHLKALKFLRSQDPPCPWNEMTCGHAAKGGSLEALKWLRDQDPPCPWDAYTCFYAAKGGHLEVLKWARAQEPPCPWGEETCSEAASKGHLDVLKWLRAKDPPCPWGESTCCDAALGGQLEVLKWLRAQDPPCPWGEDTCTYAAGGGHLEVLKWVRAQDPPCPWNAETCTEAVREGYLEILKWARDQDPPCPWYRSQCRGLASENDHQHIIKWIDQQEDESDAEDWEYSDNDDVW